MKKAIRAAFMALAVILLAASCTKTASNTLALLGSWELIRTDITSGNVTETFYPEDLTIMEFHSHDEFVMTESTRTGDVVTTGRWFVDGDRLTITLPHGGHKDYRIEDTGFTRLVLSEVHGDEVYRHTFRAFTAN